MNPVHPGNVAASLVLLGLLISSASMAGTPGYSLRLEPLSPVEGQPFVVVAEGNTCERLFTSDPGDGPYERVTVSPGLVQVQVGYFPDLVPPCDQVPSVVRVSVPGQPAGEYRIELIGRVLFTTDTGPLEAIQTTVVAGPASQPPVRVPALRPWSLMGLIGLFVALAAWFRAQQRT